MLALRTMLAGSLEPLDPPRRLGKLTLLATLGEGGMATIYLGTVGEGALVRPAAVKLLRQGVPDHDYRMRFLDEARVVVRLHHNNLVDVREAGEVEGRLFIIMELVEGRDLADLWERCAELGKAFPVPLAVYMVREILRGLHYAHTFPGLALVHRDVSPSNILIDWAGAVKLADFGLATSSLKASMTVPGIVFGKVGYMSPEQARHHPLDARADVYGCGVVLWELLTGRQLRDGGCDTTSVAHFDAPSPNTFSQRVDTELASIVVRALAREPEDRFPTADAFMRALNEWLARHAPQTGQDRMAAFMAALFGDAQDQERAIYQSMLQRVDAGVPTAVLDDNAPLFPRRSSAAEGLRSHVEHIPASTVLEGRYRILSRLGHGGMGTVYLAEHLKVGRSVAIKVLTHEWSKTPALALRFKAEARAASAARDPNIVDVFDAGTLPDGRLYIVMEFLTGRSLFEILRDEGPVEVGRACRIVRDVARAVRAAHRVGIVHRDLKPENVMLVDRGDAEHVKVLDFGISVDLAQMAEGERLTIAGQTLGTPEYMSPEQAAGSDPTPLFDIYALGVMLFEILTGEPPLTGESSLEVMVRKASESAPSLANLRSDLPSTLVRLVDDCLAIDPQVRPHDADAFLDRLEAALRSLPRDDERAVESASRVTMQVRSVVDKTPRRGAMLGASVGLAVVAVMAAGAWAIGSRSEPAVVDVRAAAPAAAQVSPAALGENVSGPYQPPPAPEVAMAGPGDTRVSSSTSVSPPSSPTVREADERVAEGASVAKEQPSPVSRRRVNASRSGSGSEAVKNGAPDPPVFASDDCARTRKASYEARRDGAWPTVLHHLARRECWSDASEHRRLKVLALKETHQFSKCVSVGEAARGDAEVAEMVALCRARSLGKGAL